MGLMMKMTNKTIKRAVQVEMNLIVILILQTPMLAREEERKVPRLNARRNLFLSRKL
jgi:hypothetical protein